MNDTEAMRLDEDLQALAELRRNSFFVRHFLPELKRVQELHRAGMVNRTKPAADRCEDVTAHENMSSLLEYCDKMEASMRERLREHDAKADIIERPFASLP